MIKSIVVFLITGFAIPVFANFNTDKVGQVLHCSGPDNLIVTLNAKRTAMKVIIEGEGGTTAIKSRASDGDTYITYLSEQGSTTFSDRDGDYFVWFSDDSSQDDNRWPLECE